MLEKIFEPVKIGSMEIRNRLVVPAMVTNFCTSDGKATERFISYHEAKSKGGWGLIITEDYAVDEFGVRFRNVPGLWRDEQVEGHKELTERVHKHGAKIAAQVYHAGRETGKFVTGVQPVAPSPIKDPTMPDTPRELTIEEIKKIIRQFGDAAFRAKLAGFDGVEIHGAHGYLINQFMSPFSNKRTDRYGGTIINRARFALEVIEEVKSRVGQDFPIIYRVSADELIDNGLTIEDNKAILRLIEKAGISAIHASFAIYKSGQYNVPPSAVPHAFMVNLAEEIKKVVSVPVITVGRINDPLIAESVLISGKADLVAMGRASIADPELPNKAKEGRFEDIIHCTGCMLGCIGKIGIGEPVSCVVNPLTGKENELSPAKVQKSKKVYIAGGGISGMQSAIIAANRGHEVHLFEKEDRLGGQWLAAAIPPGKEELNSFTVWQKEQIEKLGVNVHLNTELTKEIITNDSPDSVIIATGAKPFVPPIPGIKEINAAVAGDVLLGKRDVGNRVVIIGGGSVGAETAAHLANHNKKVILIEMIDQIAKDGNPRVNYFLFKDLEKNKVEIYTSTMVKEVRKNEMVVEADGRGYSIKDFDDVIIAVGSKPENTLLNQLKESDIEVIVIGDARAVRQGLEAVEEGYRAGLSV